MSLKQTNTHDNVRERSLKTKDTAVRTVLARHEASVWLALVETARQVLVLVQRRTLATRLERQGEAVQSGTELSGHEIIRLPFGGAAHPSAQIWVDTGEQTLETGSALRTGGRLTRGQ